MPSFTVAENILLGIEPQTWNFLKPREEERIVLDLSATYNLPVDPQARVGDLSVGMQQRVEILKTLQRDADILLLDEPTAVLTPQESEELFTVLRSLTEKGRTIILITHKLPEVMAVADRVTVMRKGEVVASMPVSETTIPQLACHMVGRNVVLQVEKEPGNPGEIIAEVKDLVVPGTGGTQGVAGVSLCVRRGEIVGIAGVSGNGQRELCDAIFGILKAAVGSIYISGKEVTTTAVKKRRCQGIAHIPEDRMDTGLNLHTTLDENVVATSIRKPVYSRLGILKQRAISRFAETVVRDFSIASASPGEGISTLSGGNLQKIVLGRELTGNPSFILANQPTRGLDVGSIEFVHKKLVEARDHGAGILLISVELEEILSLSDRILVMYNGKIVGELTAAEATDKKLGILMAGGTIQESEDR